MVRPIKVRRLLEPPILVFPRYEVKDSWQPAGVAHPGGSTASVPSSAPKARWNYRDFADRIAPMSEAPDGTNED